MAEIIQRPGTVHEWTVTAILFIYKNKPCSTVSFALNNDLLYKYISHIYNYKVNKHRCMALSHGSDQRHLHAAVYCGSFDFARKTDAGVVISLTGPWHSLAGQVTSNKYRRQTDPLSASWNFQLKGSYFVCTSEWHRWSLSCCSHVIVHYVQW